MAEFNPIRDLMPIDSSRESVDRSSEQIKVIETKLKPKAIGIPENKTTKVKTATIMAINKGSISNCLPRR